MTRLCAISVFFVFLGAHAPCLADPPAPRTEQIKPIAPGTTSAEPEDKGENVNAFVTSTILTSKCPSIEPSTSGAVTVADEKSVAGILAARQDQMGPASPLQQLLLGWLGLAKMWRTVYYTLTVATLLFGGLATALQDGAVWYEKWKTIAALLATISGGLNSTLLPVTQYQKFDNAFAVLNTAKLNYLTNVDFTFCEVGKAVGYGEAIIHKN